MTDQKLVDELEKALTDEAYDGGMGAMSTEEFRELVRTLAVTAGKVVDELRAPTDNEKLIESVRDWPTITRMSHSTQLEKLVELRDALEAAEKAHTPTDDEREALADRLARRLINDPEQLMLAEGTGALHVALSESIRSTIEDVYADCGDSDPGVLSSNVARRLAWDLPPAILSAVGFRRSEVPEPGAEEWAARVQAAREKAIAKGYTPEHDAKHGVRHLLRWSIDYARRGRAEDSAGLAAAAIDLADIAYVELERLRHVADTMRAVSEALRTRYASDSQAAYFMRQIDTALEALPEQGEPSDAVANAVARAIIEHDEDSLTCYDHPEDFCCPCGEHGMSRSEWQRHRARAALRAASAVAEQGEGKSDV